MDRFRGRGGYTAWPNEMLALGLNALTPDQFRLLGALMLWMEFKPEGSDVRGPSGPIHVARGQVLVSYQGLAEALGISVDAARRSLRRLAALGALTLRRADATSPATSPTLVDFGKWAGILWAAEAPATPPATGAATSAATGSATPAATSPAIIQTGTLEPANQEPTEHGDKTLAPSPAAPALRLEPAEEAPRRRASKAKAPTDSVEPLRLRIVEFIRSTGVEYPDTSIAAERTNLRRALAAGATEAGIESAFRAVYSRGGWHPRVQDVARVVTSAGERRNGLAAAPAPAQEPEAFSSGTAGGFGR